MPGIITSTIAATLRTICISGAKKLLQRISRLHSVQVALLEEKVVDIPAVATALNDITIVFGRQGELTERLASFLTELGQSGLINQMALVAIANADSRGLKAAFSTLYANHFRGADTRGGPKSAESPTDQLFNHLIRMLRASLLAQEGSGAAIIVANETLITLGRIAKAEDEWLESRFRPSDESGRRLSDAQFEAKYPWLFLPPSDVRHVAKELARATRPTFELIRVEGRAGLGYEYKYDDIFVVPRLRHIKLHPNKDDPSSIVELELGRPTVGELVSSLNSAVLLGDPGGGKTSLARSICFQLATAAESSNEPLPIFVTLRKFYAAKAHNATLSLLDYILAELAQQTNVFTPQELRHPILNMLAFGRAVIFFDGLDEILEVGERREFAQQVRQFCQMYRLCRYLVTSRKVGYLNAPITGFTTYDIAPFDEPAIRQYVGLSAKNVFQKREIEIDTEVERFMDESMRRAPDLIGNPLLLSLIVWLFHSTRHIPDNREEIYRECTELMFVRWDRDRQITPNVPASHRLFPLLVHLAPHFYLDKELQKGASRKWLLKTIRDYFLNDYKDDAISRAMATATAFVDHLSGRAWVLREIGAGVFEFTHRTFLEYFFARSLDSADETLDGLFNVLSKRIQAAEWNVPAHLAIQIKVREKPALAERAVERLLECYEQSTRDERPAVVEFIGRATEYLQPREARLEEIARLVTVEISTDQVWKDTFFSVLQTPNEMRESIYSGLSNGLRELILEQRLDRLEFLLDWLRASLLSENPLLEVSRPKYIRLDEIVRSRLADQVIAPLKSAEISSAGAAKARFDLTGEATTEKVTYYGPRLWLSSSDGPLHRADWRLVDFYLMVHDFISMGSGRPLGQCPYAQLAISIAQAGPPTGTLTVTQSPVVVARANERTLLELASLSVEPGWADALCFAVCGYGEVREHLRLSVGLNRRLAGPEFSEIADTLRVRVKSMLSPDWARFWDAHPSGIRVFQRLPSEHPAVLIDNLVQ